MRDLKTLSGYTPRELEPGLLMEPHIADPSEEAIHRYVDIKILKERPAALVEKVFTLLFEACELDSYEPYQRTTLIEAMTTERDKSNIAYTYWKKGKEEGRMEGREEGREEIAKRLIERGYNAKEVLDITGLNKEQLTAL